MTLDSAPHRFVHVGHSRLAYRRHGAGPDVVFVHGWPLHSATFRHLLPAMSARFTCHLFDLPGAGETKVTADTRFDVCSHARTMQRAVRELGLERYALVGHDSGGAVARFLAADEGEAVTGLVLGNTEIPGTRSLMLRLLLGAGKRRAGRALLTRAMAWPWFRRSGLGFGACFSDRELIDGEFHDLFVAPLLRDPALAERQLRLAAEFEWAHIEALAPAHAAITAPVQLIWGDDDPYFPLAAARRMQEACGWELAVLPGKLFVHEERPEEFARLAIDFLDRSAAATPRRAVSPATRPG